MSTIEILLLLNFLAILYLIFVMKQMALVFSTELGNRFNNFEGLLEEIKDNLDK